MLDRLSLRLGDLFLLAGPRDPEIGSAVQVRPARAGALRVIIEGLIGNGPGHRRSRRPGLLAAAALLRRVAFCLPPLLAGRLAARRVITAGRHAGIAAVAGHGPLQAGDPVHQFRDLAVQARDLGVPRRKLVLQLRDLLVAGSARGATRGRRQHLGHER